MNTKINCAPSWAQGTFIWRLNLPDHPEALAEAAVAVEKVQNLLDREVRSIIITSGALGIDYGYLSWDGPWPYWNRPTYRIGHDWKNFARYMVEMRDKHNAWISVHVNTTDVNVGLSCYPETRAFFEKLRAAEAIYTREGGACGIPAQGPASIPQEIPLEKAKMPYLKAGDPADIFAIVNYQKYWDSGLAREMIDEFFSHLAYPPPVLYIDVLSTTGNNLSVGVPDGFLGGSQATQEEGRKNILDYIRSKGSEPGGEGAMSINSYNWNHGGMSANDYSRIMTGYAQGCCASRGAEWQHVYGNLGAYSHDLAGKMISQAVQFTPVEGGGTRMVGAVAAPNAAARETDEWRTIPQLVEGFYLTAIQELYHIGLGNTRLPGGSGFERLDEHRGRVVVDGVEVYAADRKRLAGAQADEGLVIAPCSVADHPGASNGRIVKDFDVALTGGCEISLQIPEGTAPNAFLLLRYGSPLGGTLEVEINGQTLGELDFPALERSDIFGDLVIAVTIRPGTNLVALRKGSLHAAWSDGTQAQWNCNGFRAWRDEVVFGIGYDRMWPDTWSGTKKIHFYSREGGERTWTLPASWADIKQAQLFPLTEKGRREPQTVAITHRQVHVALHPGQPAVLIPVPK
jgi:hypothetical protein